jgi:hypothetical protein
VVLERPDAVVAHHGDDLDPVARQGVELHPGEAEGAVAQQEHDLALRVGELGRQGVAGAGAQAAEGAGVKPAPGLVGVDHPARVGDEVPPVADHDRVAVQDLAQLAVHAQGV